jgi:hypothetical protein
MPDDTKTELVNIGIRLIDDAHLAWHRAETECEVTLQAWFQATGDRRDAAYLAYMAALDREEASARDLERLWEVAASSSATLSRETERIAE